MSSVIQVVGVLTKTFNGFLPFTPTTRAKLDTIYPNVYAIGDVNSAGMPKAGVFSEGAAKAAAASIIADFKKSEHPRLIKEMVLVIQNSEMARLEKQKLIISQAPRLPELIRKFQLNLFWTNKILVPAGKPVGLD